MDERLLRIYVGERHALLVAARELARRMLRQTKDAEIRAFLEPLPAELDDDRHALEAVLRAHGGSPSGLRARLAWAGEKAGRLKGNGNWRGYSPLTRVVELEGLRTLLELDRAVWRSLDAVGVEGAGERALRLEERLARADELRALAAGVALGGGDRRL